MLKLFKKRKRHWEILFIDNHGHFKEATIVATDKNDVIKQSKRIFKYACVINMKVV